MRLIAEHYGGLSPAYRKVADFVLASPHEAALMTLEQIAGATGVSAATANRFGTRLGLSGYPALKQLLKEELREALRPVEDMVETVRLQGLSRAAPWTRSIEEDLRRIGGIAAVGADRAFAQASAMLATARRVFLIGFGSSSFLAQYGAFNLASLRDEVEAVTDSSGYEGAQRRLLGAREEDAAILFGFARYSEPAIRLAGQLSRRGVPLIAITDSAASPFGRTATVTIEVQRKAGFVLTGGGAGAVAAIEALLHGAAAAIGADEVERRAARLTSLLGDAVVAPSAD